MRSQRLIAIAQAMLVLVPGALAIVLTKRALTEIPPLVFVSLQVVLGSTLLAVYTFGLRGERIPARLPWRMWGYVLWIGLSNFAICRPLFMLSLERLPATTNIYLINFVGVVTMVLSSVMLRERPSLYQMLGAVVALLGLRVFFRELPPPQEMTGVLYAGLGVLSLATTNIAGRKLALGNDGQLSSSMVASVASMIGSVPVIVLAWAEHGSFELNGWQNWGVILLSAVATVLGLTIWIHILRVLRSYEASILASAGVIFTALLAVPILGERLQANQSAGIALMIFGLALAQLRRSFARNRQNLSPPPPLE